MIPLFRTVVVDAKTGHELFSAELPKTCEIIFSPNNNYMVTYQLYVIWGTRKNDDGTDRTPDPNLRVWSVKTGKLLATLIASKQACLLGLIKWPKCWLRDRRLVGQF